MVLILVGCAGRQTTDSEYRSGKGFRVMLPGQDWRVVGESRADLELRHRQAPAGIVVNASCDSRLVGRPVEALRREILAGFSDRDVQVRDAVSVAGREAAHMVVEGLAGGPGKRVRVELFVLKGDRCIYDLFYAASPADFARGQADFQRLVGTLTLE
jgi:hypothetical protein